MNIFKSKNVKVTPSVPREESPESFFEMSVVRLHTLFRRYGGQRHPKIESYKEFKSRGEILEHKHVPPDSTIVYVSHEWVGTDHPDPEGNQMYHLLLMLERLQTREVSRVDMEWFHTLVYMQQYTTEAQDWSQILDPCTTFVWYDGICVPRDKKEDAFRSIPYYIQMCDFTIILAPGCTHFDRIDAHTQRKMNLCYRTYRKCAECVFDMFTSFLMSKGPDDLMPMLLVRSGTGTPDWVSPLECQKLAVGTSKFTCCELNHVKTSTCTHPLCLRLSLSLSFDMR